ncbi:WD repeat protein [Aspergillus neoniger CBS 115656]|uniref:WD40 repeat-like protein n=1 Tax=Aspergillus neoniger (strain CBS 115656) TaxID=1448310 RepID=A0A318Y901_ASPNB|nr:WD40 repeat-like protein [Aspergillus neoniger CBS 115656]PYH30756.1 WD40 repeat-like protein [Aspergillus neoniger CBS 115656]
MRNTQDPKRPSKRSRVGDAALGKTMQIDDTRVKRRRTSQSKNDINKAHTPATSNSKEKHGVEEQCTLARSVSTVQKSEPQYETWSSTSMVAGQYSNLDPIFTSDDEYLLLGLETAVHVYSLATSRLLRTLPSTAGDSITGYKLSPANPNFLYVFTLSGSVTKWEWLSGEQCSSWEVGHKTISVDVCLSDSGNDLLLFILERKDGKRVIALNASPNDASQYMIILETHVQITNLKVACQGQFIVAYSDRHVFFGWTGLVQPSDSVRYIWKEVNLPVSVMCIDVRQYTASNRPGAQGSKDRDHAEKVDLVLGERNGSILIYYDILRFVKDEGGRQHERNLTPRRLHWHRSSVNSVRWSKDGNYIITGGHESVMVLWQLDTGRKQFLPHLSSPIGNIVISTSGNLYAVKLADNSIIVLSARELQPFSTITGLQLCPKTAKAHGKISPEDQPLFECVPAAMHPQNLDHLIIAVPASRQMTQESHPLVNASMLQTYDIRTNSHISRQALARTNATTLKIGPDGSHIVTPDVTHISVSNDGKWMATVDSWSPYIRDMQALYHGDSGNNHPSDGFQETFLKFWRWNNTSNLWELVTRIDGPHFCDKGSVRVLDVAVRAYSAEFATIGSDAVLRFWCPSTRQRSGLKSDNPEEPMETWKCRKAVDLKTYIDVGMAHSLGAASIEFSQDGSVLAVCLGSNACLNSGLAILIDAQNCSVRYSRVGLYKGMPCAAAFVGCNLVIASQEAVSVWDTVDDIVRAVKLPGSGSVSSKQPRLLAASSETNTFAVSVQCPQNHQHSKKSRMIRSSIQVYDVPTLALLSETTLGHHPVALLSAMHSSDYVVVDVAANVQRIGRLDQSFQSNGHSRDLGSHLNSGLGNLFGQHGRGKSQDPQHISTGSDNQIQQKELANVFGDAPPFVMPPANMIFRNVVDALSS